jgi:regulator of protease activity HflC (stomatin/prohibitin superfamily)
MSVVALKTGTSAEPKPPEKRLRAYYRRHALTIKVSTLMGLMLIVAGWQWVVVTVPAGFVAVKYYRFAGGTDIQETYAEGSHLKMPWDKAELYQVRLQQGSRNFDVLTRDGLMVTISVACRFRVNAPAVGWLHQNIGPDYMERLITPSLGSYTRLIIARNTTDELYSQRRAAIQEEIKQRVATDLAERTAQKDVRGRSAVLLEDVLILGIRFPPAVQAAIDRKMEQSQLREEYGYRIQREELESKRKEIEAFGIAQFQSIVGAGISDNYLRWKSIDATLALAQSSNTKVVVLGNGGGSAPLFLNGEDGRPPQQPAQIDPKMAQIRAETPLSGPVAMPPEQTPATGDKSMPWTRLLTSRIGALFTVPPAAPPEAAADGADGAAAPTAR